jgi:pyruvate dehydrogenase E1 component alpha subunit
VVDGNNALEVYEATVEAVKRAREGGGPSLIECKTYRMRGHSRFDAAKYRPQDEVDHWMGRDAVEIIKEIALEQKALTEKQAESIRKKLLKAVNKAGEFAIKSEHPAPEEALDDVFAEAI